LSLIFWIKRWLQPAARQPLQRLLPGKKRFLPEGKWWESITEAGYRFPGQPPAAAFAPTVTDPVQYTP